MFVCCFVFCCCIVFFCLVVCFVGNIFTTKEKNTTTDISSSDGTDKTGIVTPSKPRAGGFSNTIEIPSLLPFAYKIQICNTEVGECAPSIVLFFNIIAGTLSDFGWDWFILRLDLLPGHIEIETSVDASVTDINHDNSCNIFYFNWSVNIKSSIRYYIICVSGKIVAIAVWGRKRGFLAF